MKKIHVQVAGVPVQLYEINSPSAGTTNDRTERRQLPVLFLHGAGSTGRVWTMQMRELSGYGRMLALDLPGFAGAGREAFESLSDFPPFVCRVLDALGIEAAVWVGNSLGGRISLEAALDLPERVLGLGLVCSAGVRLPDVQVASPHEVTREEFERRLFYRPERFTTAQTEQSRRATLQARAYYDELVHRTAVLNFQPRLGEVRVPTSVIWGRHDGVIPLAIGEAFAEGIPNASWHVLEASAHAPQVEEPHAVSDRLRRLLDEILLQGDSPA
ncbi:MAG TPA: alpha/beta hydrolase [Bacilli bacterium]|nr:alpha/beta hydrolase [Bacilli bacterium]